MRLFVDNLTVIDCSYLDAKRGLVGESWMVDVELDGGLDDQNMVMDFAKAKKAIKRMIDDTVDHSLVVPSLSPHANIRDCDDGRVEVTFTDKKGFRLVQTSPKEAVTLLEAEHVNSETVTAFLEDILLSVISQNAKGVKIRLRTENIDGDYYHYSHGLKKHDGNCQRIAHGHRSRIYIDGNGARATKWEHHWADIFEDIYLGSQEDIIGEEMINGIAYLQFEYTSQQGLYQLEIAKERCYIMDHDTTVELIADHIAKATLEQSNQENFFVRAFEGVGKGAIAEVQK